MKATGASTDWGLALNPTVKFGTLGSIGGPGIKLYEQLTYVRSFHRAWANGVEPRGGGAGWPPPGPGTPYGPFDPCCQTVIPDSRQKTTVIEMLPVQNGEEWSVEERASVDVIGDPTSVMRYHADGSEMQMRLPNAARGLSVVVAGGMVKGSRRGPAPLCWAAG